MFRFEKLDVWQKAIEYADCVYSMTREFPAEERFGLTSQLRRSAVSVSSNIAEGTGRSSDVEFSRFVGTVR
jgi:four helix bundle protein